jgi:hypothetical protein
VPYTVWADERMPFIRSRHNPYTGRLEWSNHYIAAPAQSPAVRAARNRFRGLCRLFTRTRSRRVRLQLLRAGRALNYSPQAVDYLCRLNMQARRPASEIVNSIGRRRRFY